MTRQPATPEGPGSDEEHTTAFLGHWFARASADPPAEPPRDQPPRVATEQNREDGVEDGGRQGDFDFEAFYSSLDIGAGASADAFPVGEGDPRRRAPSAESAARPTPSDEGGANDRAARPPTAGAHAARGRGLFRRRPRTRRAAEAGLPTPPESAPPADGSGPSDPPPDLPDPSIPDPPAPEPVPEPGPRAAQPAPHLRSSTIVPAPSATPPPPPTVPQVVEFPRSRAPRVLLTVLLVATGALAALAIWEAAQTQAGYDVGIAGALTALMLVFWWGLTTAPLQQVAVRGGILEIEDHESRYTFDLRNPATRVDVEGTPGSRSWRVTIHRHRLSPYVITRRTVDPVRFSEVLEHYRAMARKAEEQRLQQRNR